MKKVIVEEALLSSGRRPEAEATPQQATDTSPDEGPEAKRPRKEALCPGYARFFKLAQTMQQTGAAPQAQEQDTDLRDQITKAVDEWFAEPCLPIEADPFSQWRELTQTRKGEQVKAFVRFLAPLALKYLVAPGASGSIERLWSDGRRVFSYGRHGLSPERFNQLLRLKRNLVSLGRWPPKQLSLF